MDIRVQKKVKGWEEDVYFTNLIKDELKALLNDPADPKTIADLENEGLITHKYYEVIHESFQNMEPDENEGYSTEEIFTDDEDLIFSNALMPGKRYNESKKRWSLIDLNVMEGMVDVLEFGAKKYGVNNWRKGLKTTEIYDSLMRHLTEIMKGNDIDSESNLHHIDHVLCNAMFLSHMIKFKKEFDDRTQKDNESGK